MKLHTNFSWYPSNTIRLWHKVNTFVSCQVKLKKWTHLYFSPLKCWLSTWILASRARRFFSHTTTMKIIFRFSLYAQNEQNINWTQRRLDKKHQNVEWYNTVSSMWSIRRRHTEVHTWAAISVWCRPLYDHGSRGDLWHRGVCVAAGSNSTAAFTSDNTDWPLCC